MRWSFGCWPFWCVGPLDVGLFGALVLWMLAFLVRWSVGCCSFGSDSFIINFINSSFTNILLFKLVRDHAELRCELPQVQRRYDACTERIKVLEGALREAKENALEERKKHQV